MGAQDMPLGLQGAPQLGRAGVPVARDNDRLDQRIGQDFLDVADAPRLQSSAG
jgi:hypothetical protein